jgi:short-subunit dehydrogenase
MKQVHPNSRKMAVVTGSSCGIGYELARVLAKNGYDLLLVSDDEEIFRVAGEISIDGVSALAEGIDLATYDGVEALYKIIGDLGRPIDVLALNAGVGVGGSIVDGTSLQDELNLLRLNVVSVVHLCKRVARDMVERGEGRIHFTSSIASIMPGPFYAGYAASKAFVQSFAEALRVELKEHGVSVTALMPGATDTNFFFRAHIEHTPAGSGEKDDPAEVAQQGFDALMEGDDHVIAGGLKNKVQAIAAKFMTDPMKAKAHSKQVKPRGDRP